MCRSRRELPNSNAYFVAKIGFDTAENKPCNFCPLSAYRSPRFHYEFVLSQSCDCPVFYKAPTQVRRAAPAAFRRPLRRCRASSITSRKPLERATFLFQIVPCSREKDKTFQNHFWFAVNIVSSQRTFDVFLITVLLRKFESTRVEQLLKAKPSRRCGTDRGGQKFYSELCYTSVLHLPLSSQLRRAQDGNLPRCLPFRHAKAHIHPKFSRTLS